MTSGIGRPSGLGNIPPEDNGRKSRSPSPKGNLGGHEISHTSSNSDEASEASSSDGLLSPLGGQKSEGVSEGASSSSNSFFKRIRSGIKKGLGAFSKSRSQDYKVQTHRTRNVFVQTSKTQELRENKEKTASTLKTEAASNSGENTSFQGATAGSEKSQYLFATPSGKEQTGFTRLIKNAYERLQLPQDEKPKDTEFLSVEELSTRIQSLKNELGEVKTNNQLEFDTKKSMERGLQALIKVTEMQLAERLELSSSSSYAETLFRETTNTSDINSICSNLTDPELASLLDDGTRLDDALNEVSGELINTLSNIHEHFSSSTDQEVRSSESRMAQETAEVKTSRLPTDESSSVPEGALARLTFKLHNALFSVLFSLLGTILSVVRRLFNILRAIRHAAVEAVRRCCVCRGGEYVISDEEEDIAAEEIPDVSTVEKGSPIPELTQRGGGKPPPNNSEPGLIGALGRWLNKGTRIEENPESPKQESRFVSISEEEVKSWETNNPRVLVSGIDEVLFPFVNAIYDVPRRKDGIYDVPSTPRDYGVKKNESNLTSVSDTSPTPVDEHIYNIPRPPTPVIYDLPTRPGASRGFSPSPSSTPRAKRSPNQLGVPLPPPPFPPTDPSNEHIYEEIGFFGLENSNTDISVNPFVASSTTTPIPNNEENIIMVPRGFGAEIRASMIYDIASTVKTETSEHMARTTFSAIGGRMSTFLPLTDRLASTTNLLLRRTGHDLNHSQETDS
ncbi:hypothetical protein C10C_0428 [Chlamydia serpentis]|uniref:Uncharacterized protein n=1 Tax=Chlamydia serpentis TaxID=1967782 RepID=A0A2R8FAY8_9CHLA|nr:hypothetical protein [Chlamydia serpentis]SPN73595.1 hypothetical protein C10C_0428 [Chlamydia serpentis]